MKLPELIDQVYEESGLMIKKSEIKVILLTALAICADELTSCPEKAFVNVEGFGRLWTSEVKGYDLNSPTHEKIIMRKIRFTPSRRLCSLVKGRMPHESYMISCVHLFRNGGIFFRNMSEEEARKLHVLDSWKERKLKDKRCKKREKVVRGRGIVVNRQKLDVEFD